MNKSTITIAAIAALVLRLVATDAFAQAAADTVPPGLLACADETDVMRRLSCFDREIALLKAKPAAVPIEAAVVAATAAPAAVAVTSAGTQSGSQDAPAASRQAPRDDDFRYERLPDEFSAIVVDIRKKPRGEMLILLDNQQIWEQTAARSAFRLKVGDTATITKGLMGGYRLHDDTNHSIQVMRIK